MNNTVTLDIFGRKFTFHADPNDQDASTVAKSFEAAVRKVEKQFENKKANVDKEALLVLTGLNLASEKFKTEKRYRELINRMSEKSAMVLSELNKAIS